MGTETWISCIMQISIFRYLRMCCLHRVTQIPTKHSYIRYFQNIHILDTSAFKMRLLHAGHATGEPNHSQGWPSLPAASLKNTRSTTNTGLIYEHLGPEEKCCCEPAFKSAHNENMEAEDLIVTEFVQCTDLRLSPGRTTLPPISHPQPGLGRILTPDPSSSIHKKQPRLKCSSVWHHFPAPLLFI